MLSFSLLIPLKRREEKREMTRKKEMLYFCAATASDNQVCDDHLSQEKRKQLLDSDPWLQRFFTGRDSRFFRENKNKTEIDLFPIILFYFSFNLESHLSLHSIQRNPCKNSIPKNPLTCKGPGSTVGSATGS
jgi:hypothetical protein